jgi:hypothetical protein
VPQHPPFARAIVIVLGILMGGLALMAGAVALDKDHFVVEAESGEGIFAAGCAKGPFDVATSVQDATAAAAQAIEALRTRPIRVSALQDRFTTTFSYCLTRPASLGSRSRQAPHQLAPKSRIVTLSFSTSEDSSKASPLTTVWISAGGFSQPASIREKSRNRFMRLPYSKVASDTIRDRCFATN